jgi:ATP-dependent Clp protease adaptor protein ClpS
MTAADNVNLMPGYDRELDDAVLTEQKQELKKPSLYKVLLHNDNYTTMEFVVFVLRTVFHKSESDSVTIMLNIHKNGMGVAGVYTREVAETKVQKTHALAKEHEYPLKLSIEPEDP